MTYKLDDRVKLKSGSIAQIVEVLGNGDVFIAEEEHPDGDVTIENVYPDDIVEVIENG